MNPNYYLDAQKRYWYRRPENGEWLVHEGNAWKPGEAPAEVLAEYSERQAKGGEVPKVMSSDNKGEKKEVDMIWVLAALLAIGAVMGIGALIVLAIGLFLLA